MLDADNFNSLIKTIDKLKKKSNYRREDLCPAPRFLNDEGNITVEVSLSRLAESDVEAEKAMKILETACSSGLDVICTYLKENGIDGYD